MSTLHASFAPHTLELPRKSGHRNILRVERHPQWPSASFAPASQMASSGRDQQRADGRATIQVYRPGERSLDRLTEVARLALASFRDESAPA